MGETLSLSRDFHFLLLGENRNCWRISLSRPSVEFIFISKALLKCWRCFRIKGPINRSFQPPHAISKTNHVVNLNLSLVLQTAVYHKKIRDIEKHKRIRIPSNNELFILIKLKIRDYFGKSHEGLSDVFFRFSHSLDDCLPFIYLYIECVA